MRTTFGRVIQINQQFRRAHSSKSSIDDNEIQKFQQLSSQWWNKSGEMAALLSLNKLRVPFIRDGLKNTGLVNQDVLDTDQPLQGLKILDCGCGGGFLSEPLARLGAHVTGLDATENLIKIAENHKLVDKNLWNNLNYIHTSIEEFAPKNKDTFDAVISSEVIEHVVHKNDFLKNCVDIVKPGGSIFITTINQTFKSKVGIFVSEYILNLAPKGTHEYDKLLCPHNLQKMLEDCGCSTRRIHGMTYNILNNNWIWISNTDINYAMHAVKDS